MSELSNFANLLFSKEPQPKKSFLLELQETNAENINNILMNLVIYGITTLFGENSNIVTLTDDQFELINLYTESIGYTIIKEIVKNDLGIPINLNIHFEEC